MDKLLSLPANGSAHGGEIDALIGWIHWLMLILFVGWGLFYVYCLIRFRRSKNPKADYKGVRNHYSSYIELAVAGIEVVLLIGFSIPIWSEAVATLPDQNEAVTVRVVAEQFAWNFHYAGPDGKFGKVESRFVDAATNPLGLDPDDAAGKDDVHSINKLYVPVNKPVITRITSKDVIHSFGVPGLRVKQDAIPGMEVPISFTPVKKGMYEIACSQLCGLGHYYMRAEIHVQDQAEYDKWLVAESKARQEESSGDSFWD